MLTSSSWNTPSTFLGFRIINSDLSVCMPRTSVVKEKFHDNSGDFSLFGKKPHPLCASRLQMMKKNSNNYLNSTI
jgi:hypothetical protein